MPSRTLYVKPYVFGAVLNPEQLCALAEQKCGAEKIARHCGYHATALNNVYHEQGIQECFLHYAKPGSDESLYLWVQGVLPSFNRTKPIFDIPCLDDSHPEMKSIGYVGLDCFAWPRTISPPEWFTPRLERYTKRYIQHRRREKIAQEKAESASLPVPQAS